MLTVHLMFVEDDELRQRVKWVVFSDVELAFLIFLDVVMLHNAITTRPTQPRHRDHSNVCQQFEDVPD